MNRQEIITLAESLGLLYPEPKSSSDYNSPAHMRLISKLEKFAEESERKVLQVQESLYDSAYLAGVNLGFDLGCTNDSEGKQKVFDSREGYLKALKNQIS